MTNKNVTPVMKQFWDIKDKNPNSILLFRMGDFYETFDNDAKLTSEILGIALTKRSNGAASSVALAGFPYHSLEQYLFKLLKAGHRVAICEQIEDAKLSKGIVKREVVEIVTPGTTLSENFLNSNKNNYLCSVFYDKNKIGISLLDHSTGEFYSNKILVSDFDNIFSRYDISEILILESQKEIFDRFKSTKQILSNYIPNWINDYNYCYEILCTQFKVKTLKGFGFYKKEITIISSGIIMHYINENLKSKVKHINRLKLMPYNNIMQLDSFTIRNLELFHPLLNNNKKGTLLSAIDKTITSSGSRLFKNWLSRPLIEKKLINERLNNVNDFFDNSEFLDKTRQKLKSTHDIYRIVSKISCIDKSYFCISSNGFLFVLSECTLNISCFILGSKKFGCDLSKLNNAPLFCKAIPVPGTTKPEPKDWNVEFIREHPIPFPSIAVIKTVSPFVSKVLCETWFIIFLGFIRSNLSLEYCFDNN